MVSGRRVSGTRRMKHDVLARGGTIELGRGIRQTDTDTATLSQRIGTCSICCRAFIFDFSQVRRGMAKPSKVPVRRRLLLLKNLSARRLAASQGRLRLRYAHLLVLSSAMLADPSTVTLAAFHGFQVKRQSDVYIVNFHRLLHGPGNGI